jgi:acyl-coenzyme A thioesterase PaaI-like protein
MIPSLTAFNERGIGKLPAHLGIVFTQGERSVLCAELELKELHMAPNGYANLPEGAAGFTTIELKCNHLGTAREGTIVSRATPVHLGKTTQVWDAVVTHKETGRTIALFRCTQLVLYPK